MNELNASDLRDDLAVALNRVALQGERVIIERDDKPVAALISTEDLALLEALEQRLDQQELALARRTKGEDVPWEVLDAELGP